MKLHVSLLLLVCLSVHASSQTASISGRILDESETPVEFAPVVLYRLTDSTLVKAEVTSVEGTFTFDQLAADNYRIAISYTGFAPFSLSPVIVTGGQMVQTGKLILKVSAKQLKEVNVVGEKPFIERQADKTVVNIENSIIQQGSSLLEVFEKLPGVFIDKDGNIRLRGKQGVIVVIDGKAVELSGEDLANMLRGMSSSSIQRIEIITNPSARWDASGNSGILNIVMKKNKQEGYNGSVSGSYGQGRYPKYNGSFLLNFKNQRLNFFLQDAYSDRKGFNNLLITRRFFDNGLLNTTFNTNNYIVMNFRTHNPRVGMDYTISDKTSISVLASAVSNQFLPTTSNHTDITNSTGERINSLDFSQRSDNRFDKYDFNTQLIQKLDTSGSQLVVNLDYVSFISKADQQFYTLKSDWLTSTIDQIRMEGKQDGYLDLYSVKADYNKSFQSGFSLEGGIKSSQVQSDRDMRFYNMENNSATFDSSRSSHFIYRENINAAYASLSKKFGEISLQGGLRMEQTRANGLQKLNNASFDRNYLQVFPTLFMDYPISKKQNLTVSLGRRINRPHYEQLNPFRHLIDFTTYSEGNPYLQPEISYNTELGYSYDNTWFVNISYSHTTNSITDVLIQDAQTRTTIQAVVNLDQLNYYSTELVYTKRLNSWWKTNTSLLSYLARFTGTVNRFSINQGRPSFYFNTNNNFTLKEGLSAELNLRYEHQNLYGVTFMKTSYNVSAGIQKSILDKKGTLTLNVTDVFWKAYPRGITDFGNVTEHWNSRRDTRFVNIGFTYKFGKGKSGRMRRETGAEEEKQRM